MSPKAPVKQQTIRHCLATIVGLALGVSGLAVYLPAAAGASTAPVSNVSLTWSLSGTASSGAYYGGCNFLSAGTAGNTGSSRLWTQADGFYSTHSGNATILAPTSAGGVAQPTWATKCEGASGASVTTTTSSGDEVVLSGGKGTIDAAAHTASLTWTGSFTSVFYGGLVYWSAANPSLIVNANGTATLVATLSGYEASQADPSLWEPISARSVTLATFTGVTVSSTGFTAAPAYAGVTITPPTGADAEVTSGSCWGAFPQDFVNFQGITGESSYWYSSGLNDCLKVASPVIVETGTPAAFTSPSSVVVAPGKKVKLAVTATGDPAPTVSVAGSLPPWLTFTPAIKAGKVGKLTGKAPSSAAGSYPVTLKAGNGAGPTVQQTIAVDVLQITSPATAAFTVGSPVSFTVTTTGAPSPPALTAKGLPSGLTFTDHGDGTALIVGTPAAVKKPTTKKITVTARLGSAKVSQKLVATVH